MIAIDDLRKKYDIENKVLNSHDRDILEYLYVTKNASMDEMCILFNISERTLFRRLHKFSIKKSKEAVYHNIKNTLKSKYGFINPMKITKFKEKRKETCLRKYGYDNPTKNKNVYKKICDTNIKRYGKPYAIQSPSIMLKIKKTCTERYGVDCVMKSNVVQKRVKKIITDKYGCDNVMKNNTVKQKAKNTCLKRYGKTSYSKTEKYKKDMITNSLKKYNTMYPIQNATVKEKQRNTNLLVYGKENVMQVDFIKEKNIKKRIDNGTISSSNGEKTILNELKKYFKTVFCNYKSEKYPFRCDFYIPELDLYIEYQGSWTHGKDGKNILGPYQENNSEHQKIIEKWKKRASEKLNNSYKRMYEGAIYTWTVRDPTKRKTAKENNLNWIEFFTIDEFFKWIKENNYDKVSR